MSKEEELIEYYFEQRNLGMDFSEIRKALKKEKLTDDEIKEVIREIDFKLMNNVKHDDSKGERSVLGVIGWFTLVLGVLITSITFLFQIEFKNSFIFAYGPILSGLTMIAASKRTQSKHFAREQRFKRK